MKRYPVSLAVAIPAATLLLGYALADYYDVSPEILNSKVRELVCSGQDMSDCWYL